MGHLSRPVTGSSFGPGVRPEFFRLSKNAQNILNAEMTSQRRAVVGGPAMA